MTIVSLRFYLVLMNIFRLKAFNTSPNSFVVPLAVADVSYYKACLYSVLLFKPPIGYTSSFQHKSPVFQAHTISSEHISNMSLECPSFNKHVCIQLEQVILAKIDFVHRINLFLQGAMLLFGMCAIVHIRVRNRVLCEVKFVSRAPCVPNVSHHYSQSHAYKVHVWDFKAEIHNCRHEQSKSLAWRLQTAVKAVGNNVVCYHGFYMQHQFTLVCALLQTIANFPASS